MTSAGTNFAIVGQSHPHDVYQDLYSTSLSLRAQRRGQLGGLASRQLRGWRASGEPIIVPERLRS